MTAFNRSARQLEIETFSYSKDYIPTNEPLPTVHSRPPHAHKWRISSSDDIQGNQTGKGPFASDS